MKLRKLLAIAILFSGAAQAGELPTGLYSGFVSNNAFNEWCRLERAEMNFTPNSDGSVTVRWSETGYSNYPSAGFCENHLDATFTPTNKANEWTVNFHWNFDLNFGRATLKDGILTIEGSFTGIRNGYQSFQTRLAIHPENKSLTYERRIERFGPTLFASGVLYQ